MGDRPTGGEAVAAWLGTGQEPYNMRPDQGGSQQSATQT